MSAKTHAMPFAGVRPYLFFDEGHNGQRSMRTIEKALAGLERAERKKATALGALGFPDTSDGDVINVPLGSLEVIPVLFQNRTDDLGRDGVNRDHVARLAGDLAAGGRFDPMTVIEAGPRLVVVEGHHRLAAYRKKLQDGDVVPVVVRRWTVREALANAGADNVKTQLPMTQKERSEYAWRLVKMDHHEIVAPMSKAEIARRTGAGKRTVATMRSTARMIEEAQGMDRPTKELAPYRFLQWEMGWRDVVNTLRNGRLPDQEDETEEMLDAKADELWQEIETKTHLWHYLKKAPDVFLRALHRNAPGSLEHLVEAAKDYRSSDDDTGEDDEE